MRDVNIFTSNSQYLDINKHRAADYTVEMARIQRNVVVAAVGDDHRALQEDRVDLGRGGGRLVRRRAERGLERRHGGGRRASWIDCWFHG